MARPKGGLGKSFSSVMPKGQGIATIFPKKVSTAQESPFKEIELNLIIASAEQPRKNFNEENILELADSIKEKGLIHPILVKPKGEKYEIISGERRYRALKQLKWEKAPVIIRQVEDQEQLELALIENIQRSDLDPIEEAQAYLELIERYEMTQEEVAKRVGKKRSSIANSLRLLKLPELIRESLQSGKISMGHAKVLLGEVVERQLFFCKMIINEGLSVRELEARLAKQSENSVLSGKVKKKRKAPINPLIHDLSDQLRNYFGTQVRIEPKSEGKGQIVFEYYSAEQLDELFQRFIQEL